VSAWGVEVRDQIQIQPDRGLTDRRLLLVDGGHVDTPSPEAQMKVQSIANDGPRPAGPYDTLAKQLS
jgi:hypothetical protein